MENMNAVMRSCLKSTFSCFLVAEEDITNFLQFFRGKFPDMMRYDNVLKNMLEEHARRTCLPFSLTMAHGPWIL